MNMDRSMERAYKRICFQGRGAIARWTDRAFFSLLGSVCLYLVGRNRLLCGLLFPALMAAFVLWDRRKWTRFQHELWQQTAKTLKREDWLKSEADRLRQKGGVILYPTPDGEEMTGFCLRHGPGTAFHCFGDQEGELISKAKTMGCTVAFHPWQEGDEPSRDQVIERLRQNAPKQGKGVWKALLQLPGNRYLLTGGVLLALSLLLRRALYWRLLGSLCLMIGALRRAFQVRST